MQVLRDREEQLDVSAHVRRLAALARRGEPLSFLVELGVLEQAIADHEAPREDGLGPIERALGAAALDMGAVASGRLDAFLDCSGDGLAPWDYMGALLICREAGATVVAFDDRPLHDPAGPRG